MLRETIVCDYHEQRNSLSTSIPPTLALCVVKVGATSTIQREILKRQKNTYLSGRLSFFEIRHVQ